MRYVCLELGKTPPNSLLHFESMRTVNIRRTHVSSVCVCVCARLYASVRYGFDEGLLIMVVTMRITIQFNSLVWGISKRYRYERTKQQTKIVNIRSKNVVLKWKTTDMVRMKFH